MAPVRLAIIGMGGFAGSHHDAVLLLEEKRIVRLVATCDPRRAAFVQQREAWRFAQRRVSVFEDHVSMLDACARELDGVLVPTPVSLHPVMHAACVQRGLPVFLEKPGTLDPDTFAEMLRVERQAKTPTAIGFNAIIDPSRRAFKERLVGGEFGSLQELRLRVLWPRPIPYFHRAPWSSQLVYDDQLILDSCFGNAMAHAFHAALFWAGTAGIDSWALPETVQAQLYSANQIAAPDTAFIQMKTPNGTRLRFAASHACYGASDQTTTLVCERATIVSSAGKPAVITFQDGRREFVPFAETDPLTDNLLDFIRLIQGEARRPATTLADTWSFLALNGLSYVSSKRIQRLSDEQLERIRDPREQLEYVVVRNLEARVDAFLERGEWPGAVMGPSGLAPRPASPADLSSLRALITHPALPE